MRALMDEELLENNPQDTFSTQMQNDIAAYKAESKIIATASICDTDEVAYKKVEGSDCAYVTASYFCALPRHITGHTRNMCCVRMRMGTGKY